MNRRKPADFSRLYKELDHLMTQRLSETKLCYEIGRAICSRSEKGAAVMASEYLRKQYPEKTGFSPRNVRRMRDFYHAYETEPALTVIAMKIKWTLNVIILENCGSPEERGWYLRKVCLHKWKKSELVNAISSQARLQSSLDLQPDFCYTEEKEMSQESVCDEEDTLCVSRQYLPQPNGRVRDEGLGEESGLGIAIPYRISGYQPGGDRQPGLSTGTAQAGGARDLLRRPCGTAAHQCRLRKIRSPDRYGQSQPPGYVPHLRWRLRWQDVPPDGPCRPSWRCCRPVVHRRFRGHLAGCVGRVSGTAAGNHEGVKLLC